MRLQALLKENILLLDQIIKSIETTPSHLRSYFQILSHYEAFLARQDVFSYGASRQWSRDEAITRAKALMSSLLRISEDDWLHVEHAGAKCPSSVSRELAFLASKATEVLAANGIYKERKATVTN